MEDSGQRIATSLGKGHNQGLKIIYARSLVNKIQELKLLSQNSKPDIIAVTESWTHQAMPNSYLNIPNYYIANRQDRNSLPLTIRQSQTINQFKNAYDKYKKDTASHWLKNDKKKTKKKPT